MLVYSDSFTAKSNRKKLTKLEYSIAILIFFTFNKAIRAFYKRWAIIFVSLK